MITCLTPIGPCHPGWRRSEITALAADAAPVRALRIPDDVGGDGYVRLAIVALTASAVGFGAGMVVFKRSQLWCRVCGSVLSCADCARVGRGRIRGRG